MRQSIFLLVILSGLLLATGQAPAQGTSSVGQSATVYGLPFNSGTLVTAHTYYQVNPTITVGHQVRLEVSSATGGTVPASAPNGGGNAHTMGNIAPNWCDSIPPPCGDEELWGIIIDNGSEYIVIAGLDSASMVNSGISVGDRIVAGQYLGNLESNFLHMEVYAKSPTGQLLDANGKLIRNWVNGRDRRLKYAYDTHNLLPRFCLGSQIRNLNDGETLIAGSCGGTGSSKNETVAAPADIDLQVFPQPSSGMVYLNFNLEQDSEMQLEVLDMSGRIVAETAPNSLLNAGHQGLQIDLSKAEPGIYIARLRTGNEWHASKIVLTR